MKKTSLSIVVAIVVGLVVFTTTIATSQTGGGGGDPNIPPQIDSGPTATPSQILSDQTTQLSVLASDPDGDPLTYTWSVLPGGGTTTGTGDTVTYTPPPVTQLQIFTITVTVTDGQGGSGAATVNVIVQPSQNTPPQIDSGPTATPSQILSDQTAQLSVLASDPDGDLLTYTWSVLPGGGTTTGTGATVTYIPPAVTQPQTFTITVTVTDGQGGSAIATVGVIVESSLNTPPQIDSGPTATPNPLSSDQTAQLSVLASDPDGDPLTYTWSAGQGTISGTGNTVTYTPPAVTQLQIFTITVTVTDGQGGSATAAVNVIVEPSLNTPPQIDSGPTATPNPLSSDQTAQLSVLATDPDGDPLTYTWSAGQGTISGTGNTVTYAPPAVTQLQIFTITVTVTDGQGGSATATVDVTVESSLNTPPQIDSGPTATPNQILSNDTAQLSVLATDLDGDPLTYTWSAGQGTISGTGNTVTYIPPAVTQPQTFTITVTVTDGQGGSTAATVDLPVEPQPPPQIDSGPTATPNQILSDQTAQLSVLATDPDGDPLTYTWSVLPGEGSITGTGNTVTYTPPAVTQLQIFTITVTVTDGRGGSGAETVAVIVEPGQNTPPQIGSGPTATPNPLSSDQTAQLSVLASDPDGDPLTYTWSVPAGEGFIAGTGDTVTYTPPPVTQPEIFTITVTVTDDQGGGAIATVDVTVEPVAGGGGYEVTFTPVADTWVDGSAPASNFGTSSALEVDGSPTKIIYLRFDVSGPGGAVQSARLQFEVIDTSSSGGTIYLISENSWGETTLNFNNRPPIPGPALDTLGQVNGGDIVEFDVTPAVGGNGIYSFAIVSDINDGADYRAREDSIYPPLLIVNVEPRPPQIDSGPTATPNPLSSDQTAQLSVLASDPDGDPLTYTWSVLPGEGTITGTGNTVTYTPPVVTQLEIFTITVTVTDGQGGSATATVDVTVESSLNTPPQIDSGPTATPNPLSSDQTAQLSVLASDPDGDPLTYTWSVLPGDGTIIGSGATVTYIPPAVTQLQIFTITVTVTDGQGGSATATVNVIVEPGLNTPPQIDSGPTATPNPLSSDQTAQLSVLASDPDGDPLTYTWSVLPGEGTIAGTSNTVTYTPPAVTQLQIFTITLTVTDGQGGSVTATVDVPVEPQPPPQIDSGPTATPNQILSDQTAQLSVLATDPDGDPLTYTWSVLPGEGTITGTGNTVIYTPPAVTQLEIFTITVTVTDGQGGSIAATVDVIVEPQPPPQIDSGPTATPNQILSDQTAELSVLATDPDGDPLTYTWSVLPESSLVNTLVNTTDTTVFGCPDPSGLTFLPDSGTLLLSDSEAEESPFNSEFNLFELSLSGTFLGRFSTQAYSDEPTGVTLNTVTGTLFISDDDARRVFEVNPYAPEVVISEFSTSALGSDPEGISFDPVTGNLFIIDGLATTLFEVTPTGSLVSSFNLPSQIGDSEGVYFHPVTGNLFIASGNSGKVIYEFTRNGVLVNEIDLQPFGVDTPKGITFAPSSDPNDHPSILNMYIADYGSDQVDDGLLFELSGEGTITGTGATMTYIPPAVTQPQIFTIRVTVTDGQGGSATATVDVTVEPHAPQIDSGPTATPSQIFTDQTAQLSVLASDPNGDPLTYTWLVLPGEGTITGTGNTVTYTPPAVTQLQIFTITVAVTDGQGGSVTATVDVPVEPRPPQIDSGPTATPSQILSDQTAQLSVLASDPNGDPLTYTWLVLPGEGSITGTGNTVTYTPPAVTQPQIFTITVTVTNGQGGSTAATVDVPVEPQPPPQIDSGPTATPNPLFSDQTAQLSVLASDPDGDSLTYTWSVLPGEGSITGTGNTVTYTPPAVTQLQIFTITVTVTDGQGGSVTAAVDVPVEPQPPPQIDSGPTATPNPLFSDQTAQLSVLASDPDGDPLAYTWSGLPGEGSITGTGNTVTYTPPAVTQPQIFTITVTVTDGQGGSTAAAVDVTVEPQPPPQIDSGPTATPNPLFSDQTAQLSVLASDPDGDPLTYTWSVLPGEGTITGTGNTVTYTPPAVTQPQIFTITVAVTDGQGGSATAAVDVTVEPQPPPQIDSGPTATPNPLFSDQTAQLSVLASDPDGDPLTYTWSVLPKLTLVNTTDTTSFGCPDPSGLTFLPDTGTLLLSDSEVDESPFNSEFNLFELSLSGTFLGKFSTQAYSSEPTGVTLNTVTGTLFISDDKRNRVFEVSRYAPEVVISEFSTSALGGDSEGIGSDPVTGNLFIIDGVSTTLFEVTPNGALISSFNLPSQIGKAEGVYFHPVSGNLFIAPGNSGQVIYEFTRNGVLVNEIDLQPFGVRRSAGITFAPSSDPNDDPSILNMYVADYGSDQVDDGLLFELSGEGTITGTGATVTYTPPPVTQPQTFTITVTVTDGQGGSATATVDVPVEPQPPPQIDSGPTATPNPLFSDQTAQLSVLVSDGDGDPLTYTWSVLPGEGTITGTGDTVTYTPPTVIQPQTFTITVTVSDDHGDSATATVDVNVIPRPPQIDSGPTATPSQIASNETAELSVLASDGDGDPLTYLWSVPVGEGIITGAGATVTYIPPAVTQVQIFTITMTVGDNHGGTATATVDVTVEPVAGGGSSEVTFTPVADTFVNSNAPTSNFGTSSALEVDVTPTKIIYLRFNVSGPGGAVQSARLQFEVTNRSPSGGTVYWVQQNGWGETTLNFDNRPVIDGPALDILGQVEVGDIVECDVTPAVRGSGIYSFAIVSDSSNRADYRAREDSIYPPLLIVSVEPRPPQIDGDPTPTPSQILSDETAQLSVLASDPDGDPLTYTWSVAQGTITGTGATVTYTPPPVTQPQTFTITVTVTDGQGGSATATVHVPVEPQPPPQIDSGPTATPNPLFSDQTAQLSMLASDPDGDPLTYTWSVLPGEGVITGTGDTVTYTPPPVTQPQTFTITVTVTDGQGGSATASVNVPVGPQPPPQIDSGPAATPNQILSDQTAQLSVLANDPDGDPLTYTWSVLPGEGTITGTGDTVTYIPPALTQPQTFTITVAVTDGQGGSATATVDVSVEPQPPPQIDSGPTATPSQILSDQTAQLSVLASDPDGDPLTYTWSVPVGEGTITGIGATVTYTPPAITQPQTFTITVTVTDGQGGSATATVDVPVEPQPPPQIDSGPTATPNPLFSDQTAQLSVLASDPDGDPLTYTWSVPVGEGTITGTGATVTYTPPAITQLQTFTITVTVTDGQGGSATATVDVPVEPSEVTFTPVADTFVDSSAPTSNFGTSSGLEVDGSPTRIIYLRFNVSGLGRSVQSARLQFEVTNRSPSGGTVYWVPENSWGETTLSFDNRPVIDGTALDTLAQVEVGDIVEFDVTPAVSGNGIYSFAIVSDSSNKADYRAREDSIYPPLLILSTYGDGSPNTSPQIDSDPTATPNPLLSDQTAQLSVLASDPDGDPLTFDWSVPVGEGFITGTGNTVTYTPSAVTQVQTFTITVTVTDDRGGSATASVNVTVEPSPNSPPQVDSGPTAAPSQILSDETAELSVLASDPDGDPLTFDWSVPVGEGFIAGSGDRVTYAPPAVTQVQTFTITVTVTDGQGGSATATVNVTVEPVAGGGSSEVTFTPVADSFVNSSAPTSNFGTSSALEVDGSPTRIIYLRFNVSGLGGTVQSARLQFEVTNRSPSGGTVHSVPDVGWGETTLTFNNRPVIDGLSLDNVGQVEVGDVVAFDVTPAVNGNGIYSFAIVSDSSNKAAYRAREDSIYPPLLMVSTDAGGPPNTPPQITGGPTATPSQIFSNETAELSVQASDPDGDQLSYTWSVPLGEGFIAGTGNMVTYIPPSVTQVQTFTITVTVIDDQGGSTTAPVNVTVEPVAGGGGSELTFTPVADTFVDSSAPTSNFGGSSALELDGSPTRITYLRFDLSGLSGAVQSARLRFEVTNRSPSGGTVYRVPENSWGETTLTFNNRPVIDGLALDTVAQVEVGDIVEFDVTSAVGGNGIYSFAIVSDSSNKAEYRAREDSIYPPTLTVVSN